MSIKGEVISVKMKKLISILAAGTMTMGLLAGCGSSSESTEEDTSGQAAQEDSADEGSTDAAASDEAETSGNVLIAYYSATGNTEAVANMIADATGGDLFELEPTEPYTDDDLNWSDDNSRVSQEHENEDPRDVELVSTTPENWDSYDTVFIGYPIWWGIAAWPVNQFVENNDFTGKTVIPFCTSASSGIGDSGELLADMAGTGDWQEGQRFRSSVSDEDVVAWVESLE